MESFLKHYFRRTTAALLITSSLSFGAVGEQVTELQRILNSDPETRVAATGPGSPGNETVYFGPATRNAVIRFQNKYAAEILQPVGLLSGNGFVGAYTLKKLNLVNSGGVSGQTSNSTAQVSQNSGLDTNKATSAEKIDIYATDRGYKAIQNDLISKINAGVSAKVAPSIAFYSYSGTMEELNKVFIKGISSQEGKAGTKVTINGNGLSGQNTIYFGSNYVVRDITGTAETLAFTVPPLPAGRYDIAVKNSAGLSNTVVYVVTTATTVRPYIASVTPASIVYGQQVTINGTNFTPTGNEVVTDVGTFANVSSPDGKTLTVTIAPESMRELVKLGKSNKNVEVGVTVINDNGISKGLTFFTLAL